MLLRFRWKGKQTDSCGGASGPINGSRYLMASLSKYLKIRKSILKVVRAILLSLYKNLKLQRNRKKARKQKDLRKNGLPSGAIVLPTTAPSASTVTGRKAKINWGLKKK